MSSSGPGDVIQPPPLRCLYPVLRPTVAQGGGCNTSTLGLWPGPGAGKLLRDDRCRLSWRDEEFINRHMVAGIACEQPNDLMCPS